jgi:hypothetical protein
MAIFLLKKEVRFFNPIFNIFICPTCFKYITLRLINYAKIYIFGRYIIIDEWDLDSKLNFTFFKLLP